MLHRNILHALICFLIITWWCKYRVLRLHENFSNRSLDDCRKCSEQTMFSRAVCLRGFQGDKTTMRRLRSWINIIFSSNEVWLGLKCHVSIKLLLNSCMYEFISLGECVRRKKEMKGLFYRSPDLSHQVSTAHTIPRWHWLYSLPNFMGMKKLI